MNPTMLILYYVYIAIHIMERNVSHMRTYEAARIDLFKGGFDPDPINSIGD